MNNEVWKTFFDLELLIPPEDIILEELIGKGGFGEVWKARWEGQGGGEEVAVKILNLDLPHNFFGNLDANYETILRDLFKEVNMMGKLRHKNIVRLYGVCISPSSTTNTGKIWIIMEFVDGGSLFEFIHSAKEISWKMKWSLALQAARGINALHKAQPQIIHRDVKSLNFLITQDGKTLKLADFGLSKAKLGSSVLSLQSKQTQTGT